MKNRPLQRVFLGVGIWTVLCVAVMLWLAPWWRTGTTPVELVLHAPVETEMTLVWKTAGESETLPLVPVGDLTGGYAWFWTTELPPRPRYEIGLRIAPTEKPLVFAECRVWRLSPKKETIATYAAAAPDDWSATGAAVTATGKDRVTIDVSGGGTIDFAGVARAQQSRWEPAVWGAAANLWLLGALVLGLLGSGWCFPPWVTRDAVPWSRGFWGVALLVFALVAVLHWNLVTTSLPSFWPADSTSYADKGLAMAFGGTFDTGGYEYELNRTPGFPLVLALSFRLFGPSLNAAVAVQTLLSLVAFGALFLSLRRWLPGWLLLVSIPLVLLSPPLIWSNRQIATESTFVTGWALATACFLWAHALPGRRRTVAWTVFALAVAWTTMIRMNGILLLCLPGCAIVGEWVRCRREGRWRLPRWRRLLFHIIPFAVVGLALVIWSWRNLHNRGYARPTDLAPIVAANAPFNAGMLDLRAFADPEEYTWMVRTRYNTGYFTPGWTLRNHRFRAITHEWKEQNETTISALADSLRSFVTDNNAHLPLRARLVAWTRVLGWGFWTPTRGPFTQDSMLRAYEVPADYGPDEAWVGEAVPQRFQWLHRKRKGDVQYPLLTLDPGNPSAVKDFYNRLVPFYPWVYRALNLLGILALVYAVWRRRPIAWVLLVPAFVNVLLNVYFLYVIGRYVHILDGFLWLGIFAAIASRLLAPPAPETKTTVTDDSIRRSLSLRASSTAK